MELKNIIPWGRNLQEYRAMFSLTEAVLAQPILGVGDGPASFNAEAFTSGAKGIISVDPLYAYTRQQIAARIDECFDHVVSEVHRCAEDFVWVNFAGPDELIEARRTAMRRFLSDYDAGLAAGRYIAGALPNLPFPEYAFPLALCSHFLFLYSAQLSLEFHLSAIREMLRVANEVRIFPLLDLTCARSAYIEPVCMALQQDGFSTEETIVAYEVQKGGNAMLHITRAANWLL